MKILFAASEAAPFAKTGGLGDVAGSLPPALAGLGHDVRVVMPHYRIVDAAAYGLKSAGTFYVPLASWSERCDVLKGRLGNDVTVYFLNKDVYYDRPGLYGTGRGDYPDNAERFVFLSRAVPELCRAVGFRPDVIHCNDWQTGLVPLYLRKLYGNDSVLGRTVSVFTVHNLGYQGVFWHWDMRLIGLGWEVFTPEGIEFWGKINFMKAGLVYSDALTTVSPSYSREIRTPGHGHGLEGVLARRSADLYGILNGINYRHWDPSRDKAIPKTFSAARPVGKEACKRTLLKRTELPYRSHVPVLAMVSRLVAQKGVDILAAALPEILSLGVQVVILGTGDEEYRRLLAGAAARYPDQMRLIFRFDEEFARLVYAGADLFLMPSRYEPCGLGQMIALRYGAVPVVRKTGGLIDTVTDYDEATGQGTGFVFEEHSSTSLTACIRRALTVYRDGRAWAGLVRNGMRQDFSWERSAKEYIKVYRKAREKKKGREA